MYTVGQGDTGQLGLGDTMVSKTPMCIPFPYDEYNIVSISAGIAHNSELLAMHAHVTDTLPPPVLVSECGRAFTFGLGSSGQLGHGGTKYLSKVKIACTEQLCGPTVS